jgi:copper chaperone CopZ
MLGSVGRQRGFDVAAGLAAEGLKGLRGVRGLSFFSPLNFFIMKQILFFSIFLFSLTNTQAQTPATETMTAKFKVYGNCGMCEKRIEKAAKIKGVTLADWDVDTKILTVNFDATKVKPTKIHQAVAAVGHDTDKVRAEDKVYNKLHSCCLYDRPEAKQ